MIRHGNAKTQSVKKEMSPKICFVGNASDIEIIQQCQKIRFF